MQLKRAVVSAALVFAAGLMAALAVVLGLSLLRPDGVAADVVTAAGERVRFRPPAAPRVLLAN